MMIETERLHLVELTIAQRAALARGTRALGETLGVAIPSGWPHFPEAYAGGPAAESPEVEATEWWGGYLFLERNVPSLVGSGGFKGPPQRAVVEVGYEIAGEFQNLGYATEATTAMVSHAFSHPEVDLVRAHTLAERNASTRVLEKCGFTLVATLDDSEHESVWRWEKARGAT